MTGDGWPQAVREQIVLGRLLPLGGPEDGSWITEQPPAEYWAAQPAEYPGFARACCGSVWPTREQRRSQVFRRPGPHWRRDWFRRRGAPASSPRGGSIPAQTAGGDQLCGAVGQPVGQTRDGKAAVGHALGQDAGAFQ